jgi:hypothetical protein
MQYSSKFQKICYGPNVFLKYLVWDIVGVLSSFGHEQYPSKRDVNLWCLIIEYLNEGIGFLVGFGRVTQYLVMCQNICYGAQCIF